MARREGLYEVDGELVSEKNSSGSLARAMPIAVAQSPSKLAVALPAILADRSNVSARDMRRHPIGS